MIRSAPILAGAMLMVSACHPHRGEGQGGVPGDSDSSRPFDQISSTDTLRFVGTEPFWGGEARGGSLNYTTPSKPEGTKIAVSRFGGRNGLALSGKLDDKTFDMTVTPGTCSDGMSDRRYPLSVTLRLGEEVREGCGWTDTRRFTKDGEPGPS